MFKRFIKGGVMSINHQAREALIQKLETIRKDAEMPYDCIDCGWKGTKRQLGGWLGFVGAAEFCPKCGHSEFLVSGEELDDMIKEENECKLSHPLSCHTNS